MTTMWIDENSLFGIKFLNGSHGHPWQLEEVSSSPPPPAPPRVPVALLADQET